MTTAPASQEAPGKFREPAKLPRTIIVGSGMSGIAMAIALLEAGSDDFVILEKGDRIGGTWRENSYPGLACDVPSPFYALRSDLNPHWSRLFSPGAEIQAYFESVVERRGLRRFIRFGVHVTSAAWDGRCWHVHDSTGTEYVAPALVAATGVLHQPRMPDLAGLEEFAGPVFHSARWDHSVELSGRRVGVVGTGSTGVQIVTALAETCAEVVQFQRTPQWVATVPNPHIPGWLRAATARVPGLAALAYEVSRIGFDALAAAIIADGWRRKVFQGMARRSLAAVADPQLRERLKPADQPGCKRLIMSPGYYRAVQKPHVVVEDTAIERVEADGVRLADGRVRRLDVLVLATGFDAQAYIRPMRVLGRDGADLDEAWANGPFAHYTSMVPGFPNLFLLLGPNSPIGNSSLVPLAEAQSRYAVRWLRHLAESGCTAIEPTPEATEVFRVRLREAMPKTLWVTGCDSWYLGPDGVPVLWPWSTAQFRRAMARLRHRDFLEHREPGAVEPPSAPAMVEVGR